MNPSNRQLIESVFAGAGEVAARMRELDWSATPLGPVEQWPQALRTIVRVVLASGYPMAICWGPDFVVLFNEAYLPMLGTNPWLSLGRGSGDIEAQRESWPSMKPVFEKVMIDGQGTVFADLLVPLNRRGAYLLKNSTPRFRAVRFRMITATRAASLS